MQNIFIHIECTTASYIFIMIHNCDELNFTALETQKWNNTELAGTAAEQLPKMIGHSAVHVVYGRCVSYYFQ